MIVARGNKSFSVKKKILALLVIAAMLIASGCGQENKTIARSENFRPAVKNTAKTLDMLMEGKVKELITIANQKLKEEDPLQYFMNRIDSTNQMVICLGDGSLNYATVYYYKKVNGAWKQQWETDSRVGANGFSTHTYEGDVTTPEGAFNLGVAFGIASNPGTALEWFDVQDYHYWVDDTSSDYFNQLIDNREIPTGWNSAEHLIDYTASYQYCINIEVNPECRKDTVSAIFLHCFNQNRGATLGCVAIDNEHMVKVLRDIQPGARMCIARDLDTLYSFIGETY